MNRAKLREVLEEHEGLMLEAYLDTNDIWHIGIGHNLAIEQSDEELEVLGVTEKEWDNRTQSADGWGDYTITTKQAHDLLDIDIEDAIHDIPLDPDTLFGLNEARYTVILSMAFQMGGRGLRKFKKFLAAVEEGDWDTAAEEMLDSRWAKQTPKRCQELSAWMRHGTFVKPAEVPKLLRETLMAAQSPDVNLADATNEQLIAELQRRLDA